MVQPASVARLLPALPARPPTPPRESTDPQEAKTSFFSSIFSKAGLSRGSPVTTPKSSAEAPLPGSGSSRKKVDFSPWNDYKEPPKLSADGKHAPQPSIKPLEPSASRRPTKSILKPYNGPLEKDFSIGIVNKLSPPHTFPNLATMLESIAQQLAGKDRSSKLDAYITLSGSLKASDNIPDMRALQSKMGLLEQFIQRDICAKNSSGTADAALILNALILLSSLLHKSGVNEIVSNEFSVFLVEHIIKALEDPQTSKDVSRHLLFVMANQKFSSKVLNADRVGRLIKVLHKIEDFVSGKSIMIGRLNVYRNLIRSSGSHMTATPEWVEDLLQDMLSSVKETRTLAIGFGLEAALLLGTDTKLSRHVSEIFMRKTGSDENAVEFAHYYASRLKSIIEKRVDAVSVPQIWSVVILFLRGRPQQIEHWAFRKLWLQILSQCFNCSDQNVKTEANYAWNRYIYAIRPDEKTSRATINMLRTPLVAQLQRKSGGKPGRARQSAISTSCALLYSTLKPQSTAAQLDFQWDEYLIPIISALTPTAGRTLSEAAEQDVASACAILTGLFDVTTPRAWKEDRAAIAEPLKPHELPALDSKWVRKSAMRVFALLEPLLETAFWQLPEEKSPISILWKTYLKSMASPAAKEIKVSLDTMACLARIFDMLYKFWHKGPTGLQTISTGGTAEFLASLHFIISTTMNELGLLPFTERLLSIGQQDTFMVITTPSHRPDKTRGVIKCPLHHLFALFATPCPNLQYDGSSIKAVEGFVPLNYRQVVTSILTPFFEARATRESKIALVGDLLQLLPIVVSNQYGMLWRSLADFATVATDMREERVEGSSGNNSQPLGAEYRKVTGILELGIELSPSEPLPGWKALFEALVYRATIESGDAGRATSVIEPLSKALLPKLTSIQSSTCGVGYCQILVSKTTFPRDRQALDAARRRLWGTVNVGPKTTTFDPYSNLYDYVCLCLETSYHAFTEDLASYSGLLTAVTDLLRNCPSPLFPKTLSRLQKGAAAWIMDDKSHLSGRSSIELSRAVASLWSTVCSRIPEIAQITPYPTLLGNMELFICSGLQSKHRSTVNMAIETWNTTFGSSVDRLEYSSSLVKALLRLRAITELSLPFFPDGLDDAEDTGIVLDTQDFPESRIDSQNVFASNSLESLMTRQRTPQIKSSPLPRKRMSAVQVETSQMITRKRAREATPEVGSRKASKRKGKASLRHDDSQIQFAPIESSPLAAQVLDSQILTDRQKEVRERQNADAAAMFPDIRSSPRQKTTSAESKVGIENQKPSNPVLLEEADSLDEELPATPTLLGTTDEDDFITSSPTPTRSARGDREESADEDIPSSPPNMPTPSPTRPGSQHLELPMAISAQPDSYGVTHHSKLSNSTSAEEISLANAVQSDMNESSDLPSTPTKPASMQTLSGVKEVFMDAMSSPASSDKQTVDGEIFMDAISSPEASSKIDMQPGKDTSSPLSEFDESSMIRVMAEFDTTSGRSEEQNSTDEETSSSPKKETEGEEDLQSSLLGRPDCIVVKIPEEAEPSQPPNRCIPGPITLRRSRRSTSIASRQSSVPETPETGAHGSKLANESYLSPRLRVNVEIPATRSSPRIKGQKPTVVPEPSPAIAKRKHSEAAETRNESEVPDSQEGLSNGANVEPGQDKPSAKKRRSQPSTRALRSSSMRTRSAGQVSPEMDLDQSSQAFGEVPFLEKSNTDLQEVEKTPVATKETDYGSIFSERSTLQALDVEPSSNESNDGDSLIRASPEVNGQDDTENEISDEDKAHEDTLSVATDGLEEEEAEVEEEKEQPSSGHVTAQQPSIAEKLQSLIHDLGNAQLSKDEYRKLDDMLTDVKIELAAAAGRGRNAA
ncbi:hypothetical protein BP6252_01694 [Coleophoma cylindrospora]|uniref:Telomere-associated protein Rif1 N-terminal domain-containing protein n=1 Tax=Coleophoma cylindrospora TaxID=1849047 RepID=A0A3D8STN0_9HELO|nr:hypothetical protein BP6252_01694 [Coleophoma cylindrospora]